MDELLLTLVNFNEGKLKTLAIKLDDNSLQSDLLSMGFVKKNDYFIITKDKVDLLLRGMFMKDYYNHWKDEWKRHAR